MLCVRALLKLCASLGNGRRCDPHHKTHIRLIEGRNSLYAHFVFRYRSKGEEMLLAYLQFSCDDSRSRFPAG